MVSKVVHEFMDSLKLKGLTFDDVLLCPLYSDVLPEETNIASKFSRNIPLKIPFVSAAMDTVTESSMAIAMAMKGGIGVIHKNFSIEDQVKEVARVKKYTNGLIENPVVFQETDSLEFLLREKAEKSYTFSTFPVIDKGGCLVGIISRKDISFAFDKSRNVSDYMTKEVVSMPQGVSMDEVLREMIKNKIKKIPLVNDENKLVGLYSFNDISGIKNISQQEKNLDEKYRLLVAAAVSPYDFERSEQLVNNNVDALVIDTSHGHSKKVIESVRELKRQFEVDVIAGNIATREAARALVDAGADAIKVGIGPGSICTTRVVTGVGVPQVTAIYNSFSGACGIPIIADGGVRYSGDSAKAIAVGADSIMLGSILAATEESPGEKIFRHGEKFVVYRGMGSLEAMKKGEGSRERYGQKNSEIDKLVPQGVEGLLNYRGKVSEILHQFLGGLKYSLGYSGARNIKELKEKAEIIQVSTASVKEAHPHQIQMTKDAPNYKGI